MYCVCAHWVCLYEGADLLAWAPAGKEAGLDVGVSGGWQG